MAHAIRSQGWVARCVDKPPGHGGCMSSRQILDIYGSEAHARSRHHQLVPSQYRRWWGYGSKVRGHGLAVGRGGNLFWGSYSGSFGGNVLLGQHTTQRKQGWAAITRCMPWGIGRERESTHTVARQVNKQNSILCLVSRPAQVSGGGWAIDNLVSGRQGHPGQKKVVKGWNGKIRSRGAL